VRIARALDKDASYFIEQEERTEVAHQTFSDGRALELGRGVSAETDPGIPGSRIFAYRLRLEGAPRAARSRSTRRDPGRGRSTW
jgi:hypothetical protein